MNPIGVVHIILLFAAYALYFFLLLKAVSGSFPRWILRVSNIVYITGFVLGMVWAAQDWGNPLPLDTKIIISMLVPIPFVVQDVLGKRGWKLPALGCLLILLNYAIPYAIGTLHSH